MLNLDELFGVNTSDAKPTTEKTEKKKFDFLSKKTIDTTVVNVITEDVPSQEKADIDTQKEIVVDQKEDNTIESTKSHNTEEVTTAESNDEPQQTKNEEESIKNQENKEISVQTDSDNESNEDTKKKRVSRKKTTGNKKNNSSSDESNELEIKNASIPIGELDFNAYTECLVPTFIDHEWDEFKKTVDDLLKKTAFDEKINTSVLRILSAQLCQIYDMVAEPASEYNNFLQYLCDKDIGLVKRQMILNQSGSNADERKKNAIISIDKFKDENGKQLDLYSLSFEVRKRKEYLDSVMNRLQFKRSCLITYNSSLKQESEVK